MVYQSTLPEKSVIAGKQSCSTCLNCLEESSDQLSQWFLTFLVISFSFLELDFIFFIFFIFFSRHHTMHPKKLRGLVIIISIAYNNREIEFKKKKL